MIERLRTPLTPRQSLLAALAFTAAVTLYCLAYTALAGGSESPAEAAGWAVVHILPWLAAFEAGKRLSHVGSKLLVLAGSLAVSLALGMLIGDGDARFELIRRIPGLVAAALLLLAVASPPGKERRAVAAPGSLPLPPEAIDWVGAAGNYVELHGAGRVILHRAPLSVVEALLAPRGFVRVHRSTLVRRDRIERVRPLDIVLSDGTTIKTGSRYRAQLDAENFVPSSLGAGGRGAETD